ncbi:MAG: ATP-binding protein [Clostridia bacterium]|nr:ATP-binding protein [Clostridia bacterium]
MAQMTFPATLENIEAATDFMNGILESADCPMRTQMKLAIALDELMSNVARYAYAPGTGDVTVSVEVLEDPKRAVITLTDSGVPYDPLQKEDPDVTLSAEERGIGGLGIYIVKQSMDGMTYEYRDGQNVLTIVKNI